MKKANLRPRKKTKPAKGSFFENAKKVMSPEAIAKAESKAKLEILNIRLAQLREQLGIKQTEIAGFTQPSVSKLESREDLKISTLLQYLEGLDMDVEIIAHRKGKNSKDDEFELLNTGS